MKQYVRRVDFTLRDVRLANNPLGYDKQSPALQILWWQNVTQADEVKEVCPALELISSEPENDDAIL